MRGIQSSASQNDQFSVFFVVKQKGNRPEEHSVSETSFICLANIKPKG